MDPLITEQAMMPSPSIFSHIFYPFTFGLQFLAAYGWHLVGAGAGAAYFYCKLQPWYIKWKKAKEDAKYHKDPDKAKELMEAIQRARERQQQILLEASQRAAEQQKQREELKRAETVERLEKYGAAAGAGRRLGAADEDYLPLSGGASVSSYRPPKKSKCGGGGCGR